ncbi:MAG: LuxR C-terminal-related transcriptional regulator [Nitrospiraceae bacterium]|nr:LuxR C-terminal-related transcriptional regulator [Nitrospiraceae bacterium]
MLLQGLDHLAYPSRKEFNLLGELMHEARTVDSPKKLSTLTESIGKFAPHEYSACGLFSLRKCSLNVGHSTYGQEFAHLYVTQGFVVDPSIQLLQTTRFSITSSQDRLDFEEPRQVTNLKLDFGIKTCLSVSVRGVIGVCTYFAFSNFDKRQQSKLRMLMQIMAPHYHLAYLRGTSQIGDSESQIQSFSLTPKEEEIMRWVAEGKTNWEISIILHMSLNTVKTHLKNIYQKLGGVENRWSAVARWQWNASGLLFPSQPGNNSPAQIES